MAKYNLMKPKISNWSNIPRKLKFIVAFICLLIVCILVFGPSRSSRLSKMYNTQANLANVYDLEMKYVNKRSNYEDDSWLPVDDLDGHVYSAYLDPRPEVIDHYSHGRNEIVWSLIRIIAILPTKIDDNSVECVYKYPHESYGNVKTRRPATSVKAIEDNWSLKYSAFFVICDLTVPAILNHDNIGKVNQLPESIAIGSPNMDKLNFVDVHYPEMGMTQLSNPVYSFMAVCVPVFHHSFNRPLDVIEFVEYYLQLGVTHFTFYNSSLTSDVSRVLDYYKKRQIATVLQWKLPSKYIYERTLRHEGLFASLNDCLYRNVFHYNYEYIGHFGIDEFLVPRKHGNFSDLIDYLDSEHNRKNDRYASFVFRNVFFYTMYQNDNENAHPKVPYLYTREKTWRLKNPNKAGDHSRYIVHGRDVVELGNYQVVELREGSSNFSKPYKEMAVEPEVALSHQYGLCEAEETGCYLKPIVNDNTAHRFTEKLEISVASACNDIFGTIGCPFVKKQSLE